LEGSKCETTVSGWCYLLQIELREGHEESVGKTNTETADIETGEMGSGHHDGIGDSTEDASNP
jgi:hypothetical protein